MMFKVTIHDLIVVERVIKLPKQCPGFVNDKNDVCGADLTQPGALRVFEYQDQSRRAHLTTEHYDGLEWEGVDGAQQGDDHIEVAYFCARCDHEFASGRALLKEGDTELWESIETLVKP